MRNRIQYFIESHKIFNPRLFLGLLLIFAITSCSVFKKTSNDKSQTKKETDKKDKKDKKKVRTTCYCPAF